MSVTNRLFAAMNVVMRPLLRLGVARGSVCTLHYTGRKSGKAYATPVSYMREGDTIRVMSNYGTAWWKNFVAEARPIEVAIGGERHPGTARAYTEASELFQDGARRYLSALPREAKLAGIRLDADKRPLEEDLARAHETSILIVIELDGAQKRS